MEFEGIVIRQTPFREHDAMVTVLSYDKLHSFLARGVLKYESKLGPAVNIYSKSRFQISRGKEGYALRNAELLNSYENIKTNIDRLAVIDLLGELTNKLVQSNDANIIYHFLEKSLQALNDGFSPFTIALIYFAKILDVAGYSINVDSCQICGKKEHIVALSYNDGGFICQDCFSALKHTKTSVMELKMVRYAFKVDVDNLTKIEFDKKECFSIINDFNKFLERVDQISLKSVDLLKKI